MKLKQFLSDDDAVSPVIGVILMVAITVILAAVIGAFVLGFGGGGPSAPSVSWDTSGDETSGVEFEHGGGDTIDDPSEVLAPGGDVDVDSYTDFDSSGVSGSMDTGDVLVVETADVDADDEVLLLWNSPDGDSTQELASHNV